METLDGLKEKVGGGMTEEKAAITFLDALIVTVQVPAPEQPSPDHPVKIESSEAEAVKVTDAPEVKSTEQVEPQSMPPESLVTAPEPAPVLETLRR